MSAFALVTLGIVIRLVGTVVVFADATVNSSQSAILWGFVAFIGGILGILLHLLMGRDGAQRPITRPKTDRAGPPVDSPTNVKTAVSDITHPTPPKSTRVAVRWDQCRSRAEQFGLRPRVIYRREFTQSRSISHAARVRNDRQR